MTKVVRVLPNGRARLAIANMVELDRHAA